jgi:hypothetical protein
VRALSLCCWEGDHKDEGPGRLIGVRPRALGAQRLWQAFGQTLYALPARVLSSALGRGMGPLQEPIYRLYNCHRCGVLVEICTPCDHGNIYCTGECSRIRRLESLRRASARYQHTRRGAVRHAARQRDWRAHHPKVTHQGSSLRTGPCSMAVHPMALSESTDAASAEITPTQTNGSLGRCAFCGAKLSGWTRPRLWQWSG